MNPWINHFQGKLILPILSNTAKFSYSISHTKQNGFPATPVSTVSTIFDQVTAG